MCSGGAARTILACMDAVDKFGPWYVPSVVPNDEQGLLVVGAAVDVRGQLCSLECSVPAQLGVLHSQASRQPVTDFSESHTFPLCAASPETQWTTALLSVTRQCTGHRPTPGLTCLTEKSDLQNTMCYM